jgi:translation initiation factor 3 subunit M
MRGGLHSTQIWSLIFTNFNCLHQAQELRSFLKGLGAEISEEKSPKGIEDDLHKIIGVCDACFKDTSEADVEKTLNSIVSILIQLPNDRSENLILSFCEKLTKAATGKLSAITLRVYVSSLKNKYF